MSIRVNYLHNHLDWLRENLGAMSVRFLPGIVPSSVCMHLNFHGSGSTWSGVRKSNREKDTTIRKTIVSLKLDLMGINV